MKTWVLKTHEQRVIAGNQLKTDGFKENYARTTTHSQQFEHVDGRTIILCVVNR